MKRSLPHFRDEDFEEMENQSADYANTINFSECKRVGVSESFIQEWREGVQLLGSEGAIEREQGGPSPAAA